MKDRILRDFRNLFKYKEKENSYKPVKVSNFWSKLINNLKKSDTWKIQSTKAINFTFSIDNDEERVMHSKSENTEIMVNDIAGKIRKELFKLLQNRYQNNLEGSMKVVSLSSIMFKFVL